ncbi:MAG TPA: GTPase [Pyrinomonadaceae bacterium]|jgi:predicted GTPase|nr:GTPase [Pyrinomonadaceae bacterium]
MTGRLKSLTREKKLDQQLELIGQQLKKYSDHLPPNRKPKILICGKAGNGKTTTINTLFGKQVGEIGFYRRGTSEDAVYEWESESEDIDIVDLPGLGDSPRYDKVFREMYERRAAEADGFIIVIAPPRPAEEGTLKTIRLLLKCKVPSRHIIFGFNKLSQLDYPDGDGITQVEMRGLLGPTSEAHERAIAEAKRAFYEDLCSTFPKVKFTEDQIIAFDSRSGWNLHKMLLAVIDTLPFQTLMRLRRAAAEAQREARRREEARLQAERARLNAEARRLRKERAEAKKKQEAEAERERAKESERRSNRRQEEARRRQDDQLARATLNQLKKAERELEREKEAYEREREAVTKFDQQGRVTDAKIMTKVFTAVEETVSAFNPHLGKAVRETLEIAQTVLPKVAQKVSDIAERAIDKTFEKIEKGFKKFWPW